MKTPHTLQVNRKEWELIQLLSRCGKVTYRAFSLLHLLQKWVKNSKKIDPEVVLFEVLSNKEEVICFRELRKIVLDTLKKDPLHSSLNLLFRNENIPFKSLKKLKEQRKGKQKEKPIVSTTVRNFIKKFKELKWIRTVKNRFIEFDYLRALSHITFVVWFESFYRENVEKLQKDLKMWKITEEELIEALKAEWASLLPYTAHPEVGTLVFKLDPENNPIVLISLYSTFEEWKKEVEIFLITHLLKRIKKFKGYYPFLYLISNDLSSYRGLL